VATDADVLDRTFHALADPSRRSIVVQLSNGPASVSALAAPLKMSLPAVVQHIEVLQKSGIVCSEKVGRVRTWGGGGGGGVCGEGVGGGGTCRLEPAPMQAVEQWIAEHRQVWEGRLDRLGDLLNTTYRRTP
jgi:DNA-binding transcriptional ArsR family regulator